MLLRVKILLVANFTALVAMFGVHADEIHIRHLYDDRPWDKPSINALAFSPDSTTFISAGSEGKAKVLDLRTKRKLYELSMPDKYGNLSSIRSIDFSALDHRMLTAFGSGDVMVHDFRSGEALNKITAPADRPIAKFIPGTPDFLMLCDDQKIRSFTRLGQTSVIDMKKYGSLYGLRFSPDGNHIGFPTFSNIVRLFGPDLAENFNMAFERQANVRLDFSKDSQWLVVTRFNLNGESEVQIVDINSGKTIFKRECEKDAGCSSATLSEDKRFVSLNYDTHSLYNIEQKGEVFEVSTGRKILSYPRAGGSSSFSPDGKLLAVTSRRYNKVRVYDLSAGKAVFSVHHPLPVTHALFSSDGKWLATAGDGSVKLTEVQKVLGPITN